MIDGTITLAGKDLPYRRTLGAMKRFDLRYKGEISVLNFNVRGHVMRTDHLITLVYLMIEAGFKALDQPCTITEEWLEDNTSSADLEAISAVIMPQAETDDTAEKGEDGQKKRQVPRTKP
jgi:hypothetical protein